MTRRGSPTSRKGPDARIAPEDGPNPFEPVLDYELPTDAWWMRAVIHGTELKTSTLIEMPDGVEDFAFDAEGGVFTTDGQSQVMYWNGDGTEQPVSAWSVIGDLSAEGIGRLGRLAVSPDGNWLAVVNRYGE